PRPGVHEDLVLEPPETFISAIHEFQTTQEFCRLLRDATHRNGPLTEEQVSDLQNPSHAPLDIDSHEDRVLRHCIRAFLSHRNGSDRSYTEFVQSSKETYPDDADLYLSLDQLKRRIAKISGVYAITQEMCVNSCIAYTGAFAALQECPYCHRPRHDTNGKPFKTFDTMPLGPQLQAFRRHPQSAAEMKYLWQKILSVQKSAAENGGKLDVFDDIPCGSAILDAVEAGDIRENDFVLMLSIDGAQLYAMKASDCWIYIWIVVNLSPDCRYKQRYLIPGAFIPGPRKPVHLDSFLFVGLQHVSAVNNAGGLRVFDAATQSEYLSRIYILLALADGAASIYLSGLVSHNGKYGCRVFCGMPGRRKPGDSHYWPACLKPDDYDESGCTHADIDPREVRPVDRRTYEEKLAWVGRAPNASQYDARRLETGISKPTIFSGLAPETILGAPHMVTEDLMHMTMNVASAIVELFHGSFPCSRTDSVNDWAWAIFRTAELWQAHGRDVANSTPYIPGPWGRAPRNPAEKINSGYKAWEYLLYIFSLGPGLFVGLLKEEIYRAYCKLVKAFRLLYQKSIRYEDVYNAHVLLTDFIDYYERNFYMRRVDRLQFLRPCIHNLSHLPSEVPRVGPGCGVAQWTLERFIGLITDELKQHKHPYAHLSRRALERAQINALIIMMPSLELQSTIPGRLPHGHEVVSEGYALLRARDNCARPLSDPEEDAVHAYFSSCGIVPAASWKPEVVRWSRLLLPNGQVARSAWKECLKTPDQLRRARDVKVTDVTEYGEVRYFFQLKFRRTNELRTLAMVSFCTRPDARLLEMSSGMLWSVQHQGDAGLRVVDHRTIVAVVAIVPHSPLLGLPFKDSHFVAELPGLAFSQYVSDLDSIPAEE
ncbi:hypothetical protein AURDEDRAFT_69893, partial [Auricularia subglabra TFB-10046 SS5]